MDYENDFDDYADEEISDYEKYDDYDGGEFNEELVSFVEEAKRGRGRPKKGHRRKRVVTVIFFDNDADMIDEAEHNLPYTISDIIRKGTRSYIVGELDKW